MSIDTLPLVSEDTDTLPLQVLSCSPREWHAMPLDDRHDWTVIEMNEHNIRAIRAPEGHDIVRIGSQGRLQN